MPTLDEVIEAVTDAWMDATTYAPTDAEPEALADHRQLCRDEGGDVPGRACHPAAAGPGRARTPVTGTERGGLSVPPLPVFASWNVWPMCRDEREGAGR